MARTIWLLSAYEADSHRHWANWLMAQFPEHGWRYLALSGRYFRWRIRGNPLSWIDSLPDDEPDLIIATSMVDIATLKGMHPRLGPVPVIYYFHENQFVYPRSETQHDSVDPQMVQLYGALTADDVVFNSRFNRDSFLDGVDGFLTRLPDEVPTGIRQRIQDRSCILPVPFESRACARDEDRAGPPVILWNHRWEYDKAPEVFVEAMIELSVRHEFQLVLAGERSASADALLGKIRQTLGDRIIADGRLDASDYASILASSDIVVSTAIHEFQGLAVLEACAAGATPLVPDDLCYREQYDECYRYRPGGLVQRLDAWLEQGIPQPPDVSAWSGEALYPGWRALLEAPIDNEDKE